MRVALVTGSRDWTSQDALWDALGDFDPGLVIHGGATGADTMAGEWAEWRPHPKMVTVYRADWAKHGKAAGPIRNRVMLEWLSTLRLEKHETRVIAAPLGDSRGTRGCMKMAREMGFDVVEVKP